MNDYIILDGKPFEFTDRQPILITLGGTIEESLNGTPHRDTTGDIQKWSFTLNNLTTKSILRLKRIYQKHSNISFIDYDNEQHTVLWEDLEFSPKEIKLGYWNISFTLRKV